VNDYLRQVANSGMLFDPSFISLEGYIVARIFIEAARKIEGNINQASLLQVMEGLGTFDIGLGYSLTLNKQERQASHKVWMTQVKGGQFSQIISRASN
jgi:hypothetical protein